MLKEMNKRGQEGVSLTTLLLIILGVVVIVVIILGFTGAFGFIFGKVDILPGQDLQAVVTSCAIAGSNGLVADYCLTFKEIEINGEKQYVNCEADSVQTGMSNEQKVADKVKTCAQAESEPKYYCEQLKISQKNRYDPKKITVNGKTCEELEVLKETTTADGTTAAQTP